MWIARNKDNRLGLFTDKPFRNETNCWCTHHGWYMEISSYYNFNITWDDEPVEVDITIKDKPIKFRLSDEAKKMIEKDTGKTIEELKKQPLHY